MSEADGLLTVCISLEGETETIVEATLFTISGSAEGECIVDAILSRICGRETQIKIVLLQSVKIEQVVALLLLMHALPI